MPNGKLPSTPPEIDIAVLKSEVQHIQRDVTEIKKDVKDLLSLKWKITGIVLAVSSIISLCITVFLK